MLTAPSKQCAAVSTLFGESTVPEQKPVLPSGKFLRTATTGDLLSPLQGVPFTIFAVAAVSVSSSALHLPVLSVSPPLPHEASKAKQTIQRGAKNERMPVGEVCQ